MSRLFEKKQPDRDASLFIIYCEGSRREPKYFQYFEGISTRVRLEIINTDSQGNNSPAGLFEQARVDIEGDSHENPSKYELGSEDQVWFVIDTDMWDTHIVTLRKECMQRVNWNIAQSNPCFEVWLYYHFFSDDAHNIVLDGCGPWKMYVNEHVSGGFDSRKHPYLIADAIRHAELHFREQGEHGVAYGSTEVFKLGKALFPLVAVALEKARKRVDES